MIDLWENDEVARCFNTERPLTHSLDLGEEGLAMQATQICSISDCDRPHFGRGLCQRHLERKRREDRKAASAPRCSIDTCDDAVVGRGWCEGHYRRFLEHGDPFGGRLSPTGGTCSVDSCERPNAAQRWCALHYYRQKRTGQLELVPPVVRICVVDGCEQRRTAHDWCRLHYERWARNGDPILVRDLRGPLSPNWQGRSVTYHGAHSRVFISRGRAKLLNCVDCGNRATDWSYDHCDSDELIESVEQGGKRYSAKPEHYQPRCKRCHYHFDRDAR